MQDRFSIQLNIDLQGTEPLTEVMLCQGRQHCLTVLMGAC